jgi:hypothetical protein
MSNTYGIQKISCRNSDSVPQGISRPTWPIVCAPMSHCPRGVVSDPGIELPRPSSAHGFRVFVGEILYGRVLEICKTLSTLDRWKTGDAVSNHLPYAPSNQRQSRGDSRDQAGLVLRGSGTNVVEVLLRSCTLGYLSLVMRGSKHLVV